MNIITQIFIKNIENTLKIFSEYILSFITTHVNRSLRYTNSKISLSDLFSIPNIVVMDSIIKTSSLLLKNQMRITSTLLNERIYTTLKVLILELSSLYLEKLLLKDVLMSIKMVKIIFTTQILSLIFLLVLFSIMMLLINFSSLPRNILLILLSVKYLDNIFLRVISLQIKKNIFLALLSLTILNVPILIPSSLLNNIRLKTFLLNLMNIIFLFKNLRSLLILSKNK